jgi:hypothetical protein
MSVTNDQEKADCILAINQHLHLHGPKKWPELMAKFPDISRSTMWRFIKEVREGIERRAADGAGPDLKITQRRIRSKMSADISNKQLKTQLPVAPSPAVLVGMGDGVGDVFNFLDSFNSLVRDANMLRTASVTVTEDGNEKLKNPMLLDRSIARRLELIETWLRSQDLVWNLEKMQELYMIVIEEVGKVDSETQQAILSRIRTLNNKRGLTIDSRLF